LQAVKQGKKKRWVPPFAALLAVIIFIFRDHLFGVSALSLKEYGHTHLPLKFMGSPDLVGSPRQVTRDNVLAFNHVNDDGPTQFVKVGDVLFQKAGGTMHPTGLQVTGVQANSNYWGGLEATLRDLLTGHDYRLGTHPPRTNYTNNVPFRLYAIFQNGLLGGTVRAEQGKEFTVWPSYASYVLLSADRSGAVISSTDSRQEKVVVPVASPSLSWFSWWPF